MIFRNNNVRRTNFFALRMMQYCGLLLNSTRSSSEHYLSVPNEPRYEATCAALPEMGSRVEDLNTHQDQTLFCLNFVFVPLLQQQGGATRLEFVRQFVVLKFHSLVGSQELQGRGGGGKMSLIIVEVVSTSSKPPATGDSMRTFTGGRYGFGASALLLIRASPIHFPGAGGSAILSKLVKLVGPSSARARDTSVLLIICSIALRTLANLCVCLYIRLRGETWLLGSMLQSCLTPSIPFSRVFEPYFLSVKEACQNIEGLIHSIRSLFQTRYGSAIVGLPDP